MFDTVKWCNIFQFCKCLKLLGHFMVLIVLAAFGVSWYAMVVECYGPLMVRRPAGLAFFAALMVLLFSLLVGMALWSYFGAATTDPGAVPHGWHPFSDDEAAQQEAERLQLRSDGLAAWDRRDPRRPRYCKRCRAWKPERAHHCSVMERCVLRMDHYCIWVVNCVGLLNYKQFLLFLFYTFLAATMALFLLLPFVIEFFANPESSSSPTSFLAMVIDGAFSVSLGGFLVMHHQLVASNTTTIEMYEKERPHPWPYDKGVRRNYQEVFGRTRWRQFLPVHSWEEKRALLDSCLTPLMDRPSSSPLASV